MALTKKQHDTLIEIFVERLVDNMNTVQLAEYVSADMVECFSSICLLYTSDAADD